MALRRVCPECGAEMTRSPMVCMKCATVFKEPVPVRRMDEAPTPEPLAPARETRRDDLEPPGQEGGPETEEARRSTLEICKDRLRRVRRRMRWACLILGAVAALLMASVNALLGLCSMFAVPWWVVSIGYAVLCLLLLFPVALLEEARLAGISIGSTFNYFLVRRHAYAATAFKDALQQRADQPLPSFASSLARAGVIPLAVSIAVPLVGAGGTAICREAEFRRAMGVERSGDFAAATGAYQALLVGYPKGTFGGRVQEAIRACVVDNRAWVAPARRHLLSRLQKPSSTLDFRSVRFLYDQIREGEGATVPEDVAELMDELRQGGRIFLSVPDETWFDFARRHGWIPRIGPGGRFVLEAKGTGEGPLAQGFRSSDMIRLLDNGRPVAGRGLTHSVGDETVAPTRARSGVQRDAESADGAKDGTRQAPRREKTFPAFTTPYAPLEPLTELDAEECFYHLAVVELLLWGGRGETRATGSGKLALLARDFPHSPFLIELLECANAQETPDNGKMRGSSSTKSQTSK